MQVSAIPSKTAKRLGSVSSDGSSFGLSAKTMGTLLTIFSSQPKISRVLIYGSRAKGNYREGSDIDLTIDAVDLSFSELAALQRTIDESTIPYLLDLSVLQALTNTALLEHIQRVGQVFYERESAQR